MIKCLQLLCLTVLSFVSIIAQDIPIIFYQVSPDHTSIQMREISLDGQEKIVCFNYTEDGLLHSLVKPDGIILNYTYDEEGHLTNLSASDHSISYSYVYDLEGRVIKALNNLTGLAIEREYDAEGRLSLEKLPSGLILKKIYNTQGRTSRVYFSDLSFVSYMYDSTYLRSIERYNNRGELLYTHTYTDYDSEGKLLSQKLIGDLGCVNFSFDQEGRRNKVSSSFFEQEILSYNSSGQIIVLRQEELSKEFIYDRKGQLIEEKGPSSHTYAYDSYYNLVQKDSHPLSVSCFNQLEEFIYDSNGYPILLPKGVSYTYDALGRLTSAAYPHKKIVFSYDGYNRCISKTLLTGSSQETVFFMYDEQHDIGMTDSLGNIRQLRILPPYALSETERAVAFEFDSRPYAPIYDLFGHVVKLISLDNPFSIESFSYYAFGEETVSSSKNPWRFNSKRFDPDTQLYNFGQRFYDSFRGRWLTPDPAGFVDSFNLYTYLLNDPYNLIDLQGLKSHKRHSFLKSYWKSLTHTASDTIDFYKSSKEPPTIYDLGVEEDSHIFFVNGINNSFGEAQSSAQALSEMASGLNIQGNYSPTQGFFQDCLGYFKNLKHKHRSSAKALRDHINEHFSNHPTEPILIVCHSNGAVITRNALTLLDENIRKQIVVVAIAPGAFISEDLCKEVYHYESENDFVPRLDRKGRKKAKQNIIKLKKHPKAPLFDHSFNSPTYKEVLEEKITEHLESIEEDSQINS